MVTKTKRNIGRMKPSTLIRTALADLRKVERSKRYRVAMGEWHTPNGKCAVCLAGAVMAKSLGADIHEDKTPGEYPDCTASALTALDRFRQGSVATGLAIMERVQWLLRDQFSFLDRSITEYEDDPQQFHQEMRQLADDLETWSM